MTIPIDMKKNLIKFNIYSDKFLENMEQKGTSLRVLQNIHSK
jgi:hypothetical protein